MPQHRLDITGQRYGKLVALAWHHKSKGMAYWECKCDCGKTKLISLTSLRRSTGPKSCGCLTGNRGQGVFRDLTGQKIGELTVLRRVEDPRYVKWECECSCGKIVIRYGSQFRNSNRPKTCGHDSEKARFRERMERLVVDQGMTCDACNQFKPITCFFHNKKQKLITYRTKCADCMAKEQHARLIKNQFNMPYDDYEKRVAEQDGKCEICGKAKEPDGKRLCVDHDHSTGEVRGLLCHSCNTGLGNFKDSPNSLARAISYLAKYSQEEEAVAKAVK